ncbi:MAG: hypothetical protein Q9163_004491 [Psora crenata]
MATPTEIAESLTLEEIPIKLRCATCNKLAQDAVRLPCCDQNICGDCQATLQQSCPICFHEPVNPDDCRPNKALRQTVKIFLKKKIIDKENAKKKEMLEKAAVTTSITSATPLPEPKPIAQPPDDTTEQLEGAAKGNKSRVASAAPPAVDNAEAKGLPSKLPDAHRDIPRQSIESPGPQGTPRRASTQTLDNGSTVQEKAEESEQKQGYRQLQQQQQQQQQQGSMMEQNTVNGLNGGFGFDGSIGAFPNMAFNGMGDFSQMMQFMPNGMPNPMMAGFPNMIGMPGMSMDAMGMSQGMYNGFGGPGMMNGMNMGMGFDAGQGAFAGTQAWNTGQDKFNQNAFGGAIAGNNFGANAAGYGGYNMPPHQGNFNQVHPHQPQYPHHNDFHQHGYHNQGFQRGRGRGRGGYPYAGRGRGNYSQVGNHANNGAFHQQVPQGPVRRGSPQYTPMDQPAGDKAEGLPREQAAKEPLKDELAPGDAEDRAEEEAAFPPQDEELERSEATSDKKEEREPDPPEELQPQQQPVLESAPPKDETRPTPIQTFISGELSEPKAQDAPTTTSISASAAMPPPPSPSIPTGPSNPIPTEPSAYTSPQGRGAGRGFSRGPSEYRGGLHGRGFTRIPNGEIPHAAPVPAVEKPFMPPAEPKGLGVAGAPTAPKALRQGLPNIGVKDAGFSIVGRASATRTNVEAKVKSPAKESDEGKRRERHRRHSRKYEDDYGDEDTYRKSKSTRTRDASVESSARRSSHRSHRERDHDKERDKESGRSSHRSHRSHRDRDIEDGHRSSKKRSRSRSASAERDIKINGASRINGPRSHKSSHRYDSEHSSSRKRRSKDDKGEDSDDEGRDKHRGHDRHRKRSKYDYEEDISIRGTNHDRSSTISKPTSSPKPSTPTIPTGPKSDTHAQEREARNRERQMKELQRRAIMGSGGGRKGSGNEGVKINGTGKSAGALGGRKISVKYEDELEDLER